MIDDLERDPKGVGEKKRGRLRGARAYELRYRSTAWRAVYIVREADRIVHVLSLAPHDAAYAKAERRI
jgi:mRNA-degrading endonuclease RelE of RelBE toxin-antitoxin system